MISRCTSTGSESWKHYGGRGIKVCERWLHSFPNFREDMGQRPSPKHSIDRINNDGNYSCGKCDECLRNGWPMNCRWATVGEQSRNKRTNRMLTFQGRTMSAVEWSEEAGMLYETMMGRLRKGWPMERVLGPVKYYKPRHHAANTGLY